MKFSRKMMLVPYKEENDNNEIKSIISEEIETPIKLDLITKKINELRNKKEKKLEEQHDENELKKILTKEKKLKTIEKLNEISKLLNKRNIKKQKPIHKDTSIKEIVQKERIIKKPIKRKIPEIRIDSNVASIDSLANDNPIKRKKVNNLTITKSENINFIPDELMDADSDAFDLGHFTRTANKPLFLNKELMTRNSLLKWSKFQQ